VALVTTRFIYADGSSRVYPVPLTDPWPSSTGFWRGGWRNDGLQRLRSIHVELPGQPFATDQAGVQLGTAQYLETLSPDAQRLDEANPYHWFWDSVRLQHLVWAPDGAAFLTRVEVEAGQYALWAVPLDGADPRQVAVGQIQAYGWSPDSRYVVYTLVDPAAAQVDFVRRFAIAAVRLNAERGPAQQLATKLESASLPGLTAEGAWFFSDGAAWIAPYDGGTTQLAVSGLAGYRPQGAPRPAPDKTQLAFGCGRALCLMTDLLGQVGGQAVDVLEIPIADTAELAWSPDGELLAVIARDPNGLRPVTLSIVTEHGAVRLQAEVAPRDVTDTPQWTPDGGVLLVQTYPQDGRRIIALDLSSGEVLDLSKEHWDTYFALAPDGQSLLLNNGRGGFWRVPVLRRNS
jgi:Tol biopolymer transport system component